MDHFKLFMLSCGFILTTIIHHFAFFGYRVCKRIDILSCNYRKRLDIHCHRIIRRQAKEDLC